MIAHDAGTARPAPAPWRWRFSGFEFDEASRELSCAGRSVRLQRMPARLLGVLLAEAPNVVVRERLIERVWRRAPDLVSRNVLSNTVARLRDALDDADGRLVVAVSGTGYGLQADVEPPSQANKAAAANAGAEAAATPQAEAERFVASLWLDAFRGARAVGLQRTLSDTLRAGIERAEAERSRPPRVLACLHRLLAFHEGIDFDFDRAVAHCRRACALCAEDDATMESDLALELRFELARTLTLSLHASGDARVLEDAERELAAADAVLARRPDASPGVRLSARYAVWVLAFYKDDLVEAIAVGDEVARLLAAMPAPIRASSGAAAATAR